MKMTPARRIVAWFLAAIVSGAILLALPISSRGDSISLVDSLFTASSAVCVTGLTVLNTGTDFSLFGQIVIMILIQLGGLGLMVFSTLFFKAMGSRLSLGSRMTLSETFAADGGIQIRTILKATFLLTSIVEAIGAVILFIPFSAKLGPLKGAYFAIFHSVSAFCNAGFSLPEGGFSEYQNSVTALLGVAMLVIIGGIGFSVASELGTRFKNSAQRTPLTLQTKIALNTTIILLIAGTAAYFLLERNNAFSAYSTPMKIVQSFFQSVTSRTAGFDAVNQTGFSNVSLLVTIFLMIIGASPGSTGGGIKTTSFAIILAAIISRVRGGSGVNIYKRTVGQDSVVKAVSIFVLAAMIIFAATLALMIVESHFLPHTIGKDTALDYFFEVVSAFGTVGLSLGITPSFHIPGKLILIFVMFTGRVGLLTIAYIIARPEGTDKIIYSEENVMIG